MIDGKNIFKQPVKNDLIFKRLQLVKEMITLLVVC